MPRLPPYVAAKGATLVFRRRIPARLHRPETPLRLSVALRTRCPREAGRRAAWLNALVEVSMVAGSPLDDARALLRMAVEKLDALPAGMPPVERVRVESEVDALVRRALVGDAEALARLSAPVEVEPPTLGEVAWRAAAPEQEPSPRRNARQDAPREPRRPAARATLRPGDPEGWQAFAGRYLDRRRAGFLCETPEETADPAVGERFRGASLGNYTAAVRLWGDAMANRRVRDYTPQDARDFLALLARVPASHGKGKYVPVREAIRLADEQERRAMVEIAASGASPGAIEAAKERARVPRLKLATIDRYLGNLRQVFAWAVASGLRPENPFAGVGFTRKAKAAKRAAEPRAARRAWTPAELRTLFAATPADPALWWAPRIAAGMGLRMEEALALRGQDFRDDGDGGWLASIGQAKTESGRRDVPVPATLVEIGLIALAEAAGAVRLFPDRGRDRARGRLSAGFTRDFCRHRRRLGLVVRGLDFHGLRATANAAMEAAGATLTVRQAILGHASEALADSAYLRAGPDWRGRRAAVEAIPLREWGV